MRTLKKSTLIGLVIGDTLVILAVTLFGFQSHNQNLTGLRWMPTFLPVALAWGIIAPWFGLYHTDVVKRPLQVWRILPTLLLATPLALLARSLWLGRPIIWVFALVLGGILTLALLLWRLLWAFASGRRQ
ncbi:DUF3054 domain-containing protein [bacterium]|nr:MAG: DUF3054 domain-containing protein [bacterium]